MMKAKILGVGSYVPPRVWKNDDIAAMMDTNDEWIRQRTGIEQRHWVESNVSTSDLAVVAAEKACESAKIKKEDIDCIVFATLSPDHDFPGSGCFLQAKMGIPAGVPAFDIRQQCTGFLYGLSLAEQYVKSGMFKRVLVVGAEVHSKGLNRTPAGRDVAVLFGDGAGAVIVGPCEGDVSEKDAQIFSTHIHADGNFAKELWVAAPGFANGAERLTTAMVEEGLHYPQMNGKTVFVHAVKRMPEAIMEVLAKNGKKIEDVDLFLFHQANLRINEMVGKQLGIPPEKIFNTIQRFANTTAATIPIGMDEAVKAGKLKKGMLVASAAFGSGFTWGSSLFRW